MESQLERVIEKDGSNASVSRTIEAAHEVRTRISRGELIPGERIPEAKLAESLGVSRNTLREVFRLLSQEGLITQIPNKGARVAIPNMSTIIDIYRVRRLIECQALAEAIPRHPAIARMRQAVDASLEGRERDDWSVIVAANIDFHREIFNLTDSPRLKQVFNQIATELRLAFGLIDDPVYLHAPFVDANRETLELLEQGKNEEAADFLKHNLYLAERILLAGYERISASEE